MNLTELVCSREWGEKLKEAGVPQESYFYWKQQFNFPKTDYKWILETGRAQEEKCLECQGVQMYYSAYLTDELLRWLPKKFYFIIDPIFTSICIQKAQLAFDRHHEGCTFRDDTLSNACAKCLDYLIKEGVG